MASQLQAKLEILKQNLILDNEWVEAIINHEEYEKPTYTELDYITATGTQWINTNYTHSSNTKIVVDCNVISNTDRSYEALFGSRNGNFRNNAFVFFTRFSNANTPCYNRSGVETLGNNMIYNKRITITAFQQKIEWTNGENTYSITSTGTNNNGNNPMFIFDLNTSGSAGGIQNDKSYSKIRLYSFKIYENDVLVRDFIPVRDSKNEACLYDTISKNFFYNQGTGTFIAGGEL